jgi:hypothetical protein
MSSITIAFDDDIIGEICTESVSQAVDILATRFGFDAEEAHLIMRSEIKCTSVLKPNISKSKINTHRVQCPNCSKTYAYKGGLKQHMDKHHPEPGSQPKYMCEYCDKSHACSSNLARHLLSCKNSPDYIKPSEGKFICEECAGNEIHRAFKTKGNLIGHCNKKHLVCNR